MRSAVAFLSKRNYNRKVRTKTEKITNGGETMKKLMPLIASAILLTACGSTDKSAGTETAVTEETIVTFEQSPLLLANPDFRNIQWENSAFEVQRQEGRYCDSSDENTLCFDNMEFADFKARLIYYFDYDRCIAAEYRIVRPNSSAEKDIRRVSHWLDELYAAPEDATDNLPVTRKTPTADILLSAEIIDENTVIHIKFSMPEGYHDRNGWSSVDISSLENN